MNTQQLITTIAELQNIGLELLDISMTTKDLETGCKVGAANVKLLNVVKVLGNHLEKQETES